MYNFSLWTKQNIIDIIFDFNEKNEELLREFINWYSIDNNFLYILSNREFYHINRRHNGVYILTVITHLTIPLPETRQIVCFTRFKTVLSTI